MPSLMTLEDFRELINVRGPRHQLVARLWRAYHGRPSGEHEEPAGATTGMEAAPPQSPPPRPRSRSPATRRPRPPRQTRDRSRSKRANPRSGQSSSSSSEEFSSSILRHPSTSTENSSPRQQSQRSQQHHSSQRRRHSSASSEDSVTGQQSQHFQQHRFSQWRARLLAPPYSSSNSDSDRAHVWGDDTLHALGRSKSR